MAHEHPHSDEANACCHDHGHRHSHAPVVFGAAFAVGVTLNAAFVVVEVVSGLLAHSLALIADAGHNLGDVFGLLLAWGAAAGATWRPDARHTYGWRRSSVLAALANSVVLLISVGVIAWEAVRRLRAPAPVEAYTVIWVSALGIAINAGTAAMFMSGRKGDLNIKAAFQHMAADALISAGVVTAGVAIVFTRWFWLDPAISLALVAVIVVGTWSLLRDSFALALDAVPPGMDPSAISQYLSSLPGVASLHHLHIWGLSTTDVALTAHVVLAGGVAGNDLLSEINLGLQERFGIGHATIQLESPALPGCADWECHAGG